MFAEVRLLSSFLLLKKGTGGQAEKSWRHAYSIWNPWLKSLKIQINVKTCFILILWKVSVNSIIFTHYLL